MQDKTESYFLEDTSVVPILTCEAHPKDLLGQPGDSHAIDQPEADSDAWASDCDEESSSLDEEHFLQPFNDDDDASMYTGGKDCCTPEEAKQYRERLRTVGEDRFLSETVEKGTVSARKLISAFGFGLSKDLEGLDDRAYLPLLEMVLMRLTHQRKRLEQFSSLNDVSELVKTAKNIIVLTGAGISTSLGIPDFRSKGTGLYARLPDLGLSDPQEVFDIDLFREDPSIFYSVAKDILPSTTRFSPTHSFIKLLQDKGKLLTNFTQNIDNLEFYAGVQKGRLVQCHGSFATATCIKCKFHTAGETIYPELREGRVAQCPACLVSLEKIREQRTAAAAHSGAKRKRQHDDDSSCSDDDAALEAGVMKPDIIFFGEALPSAFHDRLIDHDREKVDLVIVLGTSLRVKPVSEVGTVIPAHVPQIYISRERCKHFNFDVTLLGECDVIVQEICRKAGWDLEHPMLSPDVQIDVTQVEEAPGTWQVSKSQILEDQVVTATGKSTMIRQEIGSE